MKRILTLLLLLTIWLSGFAQKAGLLSTPYKASTKKATIGYYLKDVKRKTGIAVSFSNATIDPKQNVSLTGNEQTVESLLQHILSAYGVSIIERNGKILIISQDLKKKSSQENSLVINGYVKDAVSKEVLIGAIIQIPSAGAGIVTNDHGYYSITIPSGDHRVICSYIGFTADTFTLHADSDNRRDILLSSGNVLTEVVVNNSANNHPDHIKLTLNDINGRPALLGENDVMRALQNIPGVQCGADGSSSVLVRGGDPGQNLNLLDGVPVYYVDHFFGLTSIFNSEAVKSVDFYKGAFPARYGGRLSSVIDVNTKDGDMEKIHGQFSLGLVKGILNLEGPIVKNKASFMLSARRTWIDALWRPFTNTLGLNFYDVNLKGNYIADDNNRFYVSLYNGSDNVKFSSLGVDGRTKYANSIGSVKWTRIVNPKLFLNTSVTFSQFQYLLNTSATTDTNGTKTVIAAYTGKSTIADHAIKMQTQWYPSAQHSIQTGIQYSYSKFTPVSRESEALNNASPPYIYSNEITLFAEDEIKLTDRWTVRPGLHFANWISTKYSYSSLQPRLYISYLAAKNHIINGSFTRMSQFLHPFNNNGFGLQSDFWLPSTDKLTPEESIMGTVGYSAKLPRKFSYGIDLYYKDITGVTMFDPGNNIFNNVANWDEKLLQGEGWSYGAEFNLQKKFGSLTTSVGYTWSKSWRKFNMLNNGEAFPYRYDRRHNLKIALAYKKGKRFAATANWTYMSGEAITLPDQIYADLDNNLNIDVNSFTQPGYAYNYSEINGYRLPPIHRLDVNFDFIKQKRKSERTWSVGVFNVYAQKNVFLVELQPVSSGEFSLKGRSFFMFIPHISYKLTF